MKTKNFTLTKNQWLLVAESLDTNLFNMGKQIDHLEECYAEEEAVTMMVEFRKVMTIFLKIAKQFKLSVSFETADYIKRIGGIEV